MKDPACLRQLCWIACCLLLAAACSTEAALEPVSPAGGSAGSPGAGGAAGVPAGGGAGAPSRTFLGRACGSDVDCGLGLVCWTGGGTELDEGWPAQGYCTTPCEESSACAGPQAGICHRYSGAGYCLLSCDPDASPEEKCHGRREVACVPASSGDGAVCMPRCGSDTDCCAGSGACEGTYCSPATGLCSASQPAGAATGTPCDPDAPAACRGRCIELGAGDDTATVCADLCTFGVYPSCGWSPSAGRPAEARCAHADGVEPLPGNGGLCAKLCDCDADCLHEALVCVPFPEPDQMETQRDGVCDLAESGIPRCPLGVAGAPSGAGGGGAGAPAAQAGAASAARDPAGGAPAAASGGTTAAGAAG